MSQICLQQIGLEVIHAKLPIHVCYVHVMTIRRQLTSGDGRRRASLRRDRLNARCLMGVPQAHVAIIGCRDDHGRVERDVQGGDGLWVR